MTASEWLLLALRLAHSLAAMVWLGGGVYFLLVVRPVSGQLLPPREFISAINASFGEWARLSTLIMLATGIVLMFDRLSNGSGGLLYAALLAVKVVAAVIAFWLAGVRPARRAIRARGRRRAASELIVALGLLAFVLGVVLSSVYGRATT